MEIRLSVGLVIKAVVCKYDCLFCSCFVFVYLFCFVLVFVFVLFIYFVLFCCMFTWGKSLFFLLVS